MSAPTTLSFSSERPCAVAGSAGFTLLEVMIAVGIIAIALVSLIGAQSQSVSIAAAARFDTTAALLAQEKMAELCVQGYSGVSDGEGDFGEDYPGFAWKVEVRELTTDETGLDGLAGMLKAVDLTVRSRVDEQRGFSLRTILLKDFQAPP
ncbi:MAG: prepilin-type N-terminal cleavage/methylation domain-containing protein [Desulfobulbus sp.]|jgi:general secretion pathway protein I|nr:prepilin-type N-terminal cleavage/methylation domain-containing protein [Desulfobulbus sp.]